MSPLTGQSRSISPFRRLVIDLMHFCAQVPSATVERRMELGPLVEARATARPPHTWSALLIKAYALVAARTPLLRTAYVSWPWPRFYEHPVNIAAINVDRQVETERIVLQARIEQPEARSLQELDALIRDLQDTPLESIPAYRAAMCLGRVPWPFRRLVFWAGLNVLGSVRCHHFGTFGISSVGAQGAGLLHVPTLLTSMIHCGMLDEAGRLDVRLSFDHRVLDGALAAGALTDLEAALLGEVLTEAAQSALSLPG